MHMPSGITSSTNDFLLACTSWKGVDSVVLLPRSVNKIPLTWTVLWRVLKNDFPECGDVLTPRREMKVEWMYEKNRDNSEIKMIINSSRRGSFHSLIMLKNASIRRGFLYSSSINKWRCRILLMSSTDYVTANARVCSIRYVLYRTRVFFCIHPALYRPKNVNNDVRKDIFEIHFRFGHLNDSTSLHSFD